MFSYYIYCIVYFALFLCIVLNRRVFIVILTLHPCLDILIHVTFEIHYIVKRIGDFSYPVENPLTDIFHVLVHINIMGRFFLLQKAVKDYLF